MLDWEGLLTEYKSLVKLRAALLENAGANVVNLERLGPHRFHLSRGEDAPSPAGLKNGFVYGRGFVGSQPQTKAWTVPRTRVLWISATLTGVLVAVAGLIAIPNSSTYVKQTPAGATSAKILKQPNDRGGQQCQSAQNQADVAANSAKLPASVLQSQIIGGFRELTLVSSCDQKAYQVVMYLENHAWKAKSATPVGSHS